MARPITFHATATDALGRPATLDAVFQYNEGPIIDAVNVVQLGSSLQVTIVAHDPEGDVLTYALTASEGTVTAGAQPNVFIWNP